jgi:sulfite exporter TauE/SafE
MNGKMILSIIMMVLGALSGAINIWAFLLTSEIRSLMFALLGIFVVIVGIVNFRRLRAGQPR